MKILILSCNTGGGHNSAAKSLAEGFAKRNIPCEVVDALAFSSQRASDLVSNSYLKMIQRTPKLFGELYHVTEEYGKYQFSKNKKRKSPAYILNFVYTQELLEYIQTHGFDTIICTHIFPAQAVTHLWRKHSLQAKLYFIATDYSCAPLLEETELDGYFIPHADLIHEFVERGLPREKLQASGIPVAEKFLQVLDRQESRKKVELESHHRSFLLMSGSMGWGGSLDITAHLLKYGDDNTRIVILVGNSKKLENKIKEQFHNDPRIITVPFTNEVQVYMDACDVLLTKPGGLTTTEAAVKRMLLIHTAPIPGCETTNARFFVDHNLSILAESPERAAQKAHELVDDPFLQEQMLAAQKHYIRQNSTEFICEFIEKNN